MSRSGSKAPDGHRVAHESRSPDGPIRDPIGLRDVGWALAHRAIPMIGLRIPLLLLVQAGCNGGPRYLGNGWGEIEGVEGHAISVHQAIELARPHLAESYRLRSEGREWPPARGRAPVPHVFLDGHWYLISSESHPAMDLKYDLGHPVRVHSRTGEVIAPE